MKKPNAIPSPKKVVDILPTQCVALDGVFHGILINMKVVQDFSNIPLVVFDWDGTILDTTAAIAISIRYACERLRLPVPSETRARSVIGLGWREGMRIIAPTCPLEEWPEFRQLCEKRYREEEEQIHLFTGIRELITALHARGTHLAIATGNSRRGLERMLDETGLRAFFVDTQTADENTSKPAPDMLEAVSLATGYEPHEMVMVGDTTHDLQMAAAFGCAGIGVTWGAMSAELLASSSPAAICSRREELAALFGITLTSNGMK